MNFDLEKDSYSKEEVINLLNDNVDSLTNEIATLKNDYEEQIKGLNNSLKDYETLKKSNLESSIKMEIFKNGLNDDVFDLVYDDDLEKSKNKIETLKSLYKNTQVNEGYKPTEHTSTSDYDNAKSKGDVTSMIKNKFSNILK